MVPVPMPVLKKSYRITNPYSTVRTCPVAIANLRSLDSVGYSSIGRIPK